jgi:hypothetical protein
MRAQELVDAACAHTGLSDFGADTWREGFNVLLRSINDDAALSALGEEVLADRLTGILRNRLEIEDWFRRHPEIGEQRISPPLFSVGLPRTGTTALANLLALDPARRSLRTWEANQPCPPPATATEHSDPRITQAAAGIAMQKQMFPDFVGMLPVSAAGPEECIFALALDFRSQLFEAMVRIPTYSDWLLKCDMEPAYRYYHRVLQLLQWRCPPTRWSLKAPSHMHAIVELDRVFPGARFVMTHRSIINSIPSTAALVSALTASLTKEPDPCYLGRHFAEFWATALRRLIDFREAGNEERFFDIEFADLQSKPIDVVRRLYAWLGEDISAEAERRMVTWWEDSAKERQPAGRRRAEDFGIDVGELSQRFAFYTERFEFSGMMSEKSQPFSYDHGPKKMS